MADADAQDLSPGLRRRSLALGLPLAAAAVALLPSAVRAQTQAGVQRQSATLMGTRVDIIVDHPDVRLRQLALDAAWAEMQRLSELMSRYRSSSQLSLLARAAGSADYLTLAPELIDVLAQARARAQASDGLFDPTVGAYAGWRFEQGQEQALPDAAALRRQQSLVDWRDLQLDSRTGRARLARQGMRLDLGGAAKLPILQAGLRCLQRAGIRNALINGGGDVLACGQLQGRDWRVGLRDPRAPDQLLGVLNLDRQGAVLAASGDYERGFFSPRHGRRLHHILDPRSGLPSSGLQGVALLARDVEAVNAWGAAMMVAGPRQAQAWAAGMSGTAELMLAGPGGLWLSPGMARRLQTA